MEEPTKGSKEWFQKFSFGNNTTVDSCITYNDILNEKKQRKKILYKMRYEGMMTNPEEKYKIYIQSAKRRNKEFRITLEQATKLFQSSCFYCGCKDKVRLNGIDRKDNTIGYLPNNVVSCCTFCNISKHTLSYDDFILQCHRIAKRHPIKSEYFQ
jgi:hypothetical protein